jgi:uncharacterized protein YeaO (DUF488 family)
MTIDIKRAYEPASPDDGQRVLVDRVWPRGRTREALQISDWFKDLAPSSDLRRWFGHDPDRWEEFARRYREELKSPERAKQLNELEETSAKRKVTLVYGARDREHNQAVVLRDVIDQASKPRS